MPATTLHIDNQLTGQIISIVCEVWGIDRPSLVSHSHKRPLPWARSLLCEYLRLYAGHNTVSCAAMLHVKPDAIQCYNYRYHGLKKMYIPFRDKDEEIHRRIKEIMKCKPTK